MENYPICAPAVFAAIGYGAEIVDFGFSKAGDGVEIIGWRLPGIQPPSRDQIDAYIASSAWLNLAKEQAHERRAARRTQAELAGFTHRVGEQSYRIDSDRDSILRIANGGAAALIAVVTQSEWSTVWKCADKQELPLDAQGMLAMQVSFVRHGQACHIRSQALEDEIEAAESLEALAAIDLNSGWPV